MKIILLAALLVSSCVSSQLEKRITQLEWDNRTLQSLVKQTRHSLTNQLCAYHYEECKEKYDPELCRSYSEDCFRSFPLNDPIDQFPQVP